MLLDEVAVTDAATSPAARSGREALFACALDPWEADDVLSEIPLLTVNDDGEATWRLQRLSGQQASVAAGGRLSAQDARSFVLATSLPNPSARARRGRGGTVTDG